MYTRITLDRGNGVADVVIDGQQHLFSSFDAFVKLTGYPYSETTNIVAYEPERNMFIVERRGGITVAGSDLEEIIWCDENIELVRRSLHEDRMNSMPPELSVRDLRDQRLTATDWMVIRHRDELDMGGVTTLTAEQYSSVLTYRKALRDLPLSGTDIERVVWPSLVL